MGVHHTEVAKISISVIQRPLYYVIFFFFFLIHGVDIYGLYNNYLNNDDRKTHDTVSGAI